MATLIATTVVVAPLPLSIDIASAADTDVAPTFDLSISKYTNKAGTIINLNNDNGNPAGGALSPTTADPARFTALVDGQSNAVKTVSHLSTYIVQLTLTTVILKDQVVTISYSSAGSSAPIQSPLGKPVVSFGPSAVTNYSTVVPTAPNTPGVATVVAGEESATITVTAPTGGTAPTSYEVTATPGGAKCTVDGASGSCTITGLTAGAAYTFTTIAKVSTGDSSASTASPAITVLPKTTTTTVPAGYTPSWDKEPLTDSETDANTVGIFPAISPGLIIITDEMGFTLDKKNGIKPKIRMKNYAGQIKMSISASYKVGAKTKKYKCTFAPFGTTKKIKTSKWRWYTPKKACILPAPLVAAVRANTATLSASGKWSRQWLTTSKKARPDKTKIKPRTLRYTMKAKPAAVK